MTLLSSQTKHILHCCLFLFVMVIFETVLMPKTTIYLNPWDEYGYFASCILYFLKLSYLVLLPQTISSFIGLIYYNSFPDKVPLKVSPILLPFISFRVVTKGNFRELVINRVRRNMEMCTSVGLINFMFEIVTDRRIGFEKDNRVREVVVPFNYKTKSGALFKARALQYCLEDEINVLHDNDWIVHLDEETLLTENSLKGIFNFISEGKYNIGQGLITYADEQVVNLVTTIADTYRVAVDMGDLRVQLKMFHKLLSTWKGSYIVIQYGIEKDISFDNGPESSLAEDLFFGLKAANKGYTFDFIEGEMWEKSTFTVWDFIQQRKRWIQGVLFIILSEAVPFKQKLLLVGPLYSFFFPLPVLLLLFLFPISVPYLFNFIFQFMTGVGFYLYIYGILKSFSFYKMGFAKTMICFCGPVFMAPFYMVCTTIAAVWALLGNKRHFYVVDKYLITDIV